MKGAAAGVAWATLALVGTLLVVVGAAIHPQPRVNVALGAGLLLMFAGGVVCGRWIRP